MFRPLCTLASFHLPNTPSSRAARVHLGGTFQVTLSRVDGTVNIGHDESRLAERNIASRAFLWHKSFRLQLSHSSGFSSRSTQEGTINIAALEPTPSQAVEADAALHADKKKTRNKTDVKPWEWPAVYFETGKGKLSSLVTLTAAAGFAIAVPVGAPFSWTGIAMTSAGTMLSAMSASAFNQILERENDSRMVRTGRRPLVIGKISPLHASIVASCAGVGGVALLAVTTNPLAASLAAANIGNADVASGCAN
eukprot:756071-Hanusia_phi.AAC.6